MDTGSVAPPAPDNTARYREVREQALADEKVKAAQEKLDTATGEQQRQAERDYYKALFGTMRKIDPALKERIDGTEAAALRRVEKRGATE